jgi:cytochrome c1
VHGFQHLCFFWTALLFWWALVQGGYGRLGYGVAVLFVFATSVHTSVLGALLTFASYPWYPVYADRSAAWSVSPLADQQLAGMYMWVPSSLTFLVLGLALVAAWIGEAERRVALGRPDLAGAPARRPMPDRPPSCTIALFGALAATLAAGCGRSVAEAARGMTGGEPERGRAAVRRYGCSSCHAIPGVGGPQGLVGPPLTAMSDRAYLAGALPNTPENLVRWIRHPQEIRSPNVMPDMGVTEEDGRDIAAYLYTLR